MIFNRMHLAVIVCVFNFFYPAQTHAQGAFSNGFQMGSQIGAQAVANATAAQQAYENEVARRRQLIRQYGTPALDRFDALEKSSDKWANEMAANLKKIREGS